MLMQNFHYLTLLLPRARGINVDADLATYVAVSKIAKGQRTVLLTEEYLPRLGLPV